MVIFAHLSQVFVEENAIVRAGEIVGLSGSSGNSTGPHVHYEIRRKAMSTNPLYVYYKVAFSHLLQIIPSYAPKCPGKSVLAM